ncbi:helix-turn-helix domain-containing protein [Paenibacillus sp. IB182496]|uniref:Helix-turn-helix domain-containing protein n=1 Tax=Paenibacillus sabuli TaxID=2772509 RepID=A0A927BXQ0_9BACL|nr:helix-turn-helix domain-containing protein [Paenibacillus sabuli]MBD2847344.1 helix-turn-helix domain-containing protein [Paenibacillus sabuli]
MRRTDKHGDSPGRTGTIIAGHYMEPDTYRTERPEGRGDWLLLYTLEGEGWCTAGEQRRACRPGDLVALRPRAPHNYGTAAGVHWRFMWVHFPDSIPEAALLPEHACIGHTIAGSSARARVLRAFQRLLADTAERRELWEELSRNAIGELLLLLARSTRRRIDARVDEALQLMSARLQEHLRVEELAASVGLSASRLAHLFKRETGLSVIETMNRMRIRQAALLLAHTDRTAAEAAHATGFHNYHHFAKQFRKHYGVPPSAYRADS